jgi:hypothetical protein
MIPTTEAERWLISRVSAKDPCDIQNVVALMMQLRRTGSLTVNFSQGSIGVVEFRERETRILKLGLDKANGNESTLQSG